MTHMRRVKTMTCVLATMTLVTILLSASVFAANAKDPRKIVRFRPVTSTLLCLLGQCVNLNTSDGMEKAIAEVVKYGGTVMHQLPLINALAVELPESEVLAIVTNLLTSPYVLEVVDDLLTSVDPICPTTTLPTIPESYPWGQHQIALPAAHQQWPDLQGSKVKVAVLDTGIAAHCEFALADDPSCLSSRVDDGYNALAEQLPWQFQDDHGHGTHIAGIIAANLNTSLVDLGGMIGVAPQATVVPVKVLDHNGTGYLSDVINGLQWVRDQNVKQPGTEQITVINMSFGFTNDSSALREAIKSIQNSGVLMVASAGNRCAAAPITEDGGGDGDCLGGGPASSCPTPLTDITYPAAYQEVLAVGATDINNWVTEYSLAGGQLDIVAPGGARDPEAPDNGQIFSTNIAAITNTGIVVYGRAHGSSQAAAYVSGAVGLASQVQSGLSIAQLRDLLKTTSVKLIDPLTGVAYPPDQQGVGRIDVERLLDALNP